MPTAARGSPTCGSQQNITFAISTDWEKHRRRQLGIDESANLYTHRAVAFGGPSGPQQGARTTSDWSKLVADGIHRDRHLHSAAFSVGVSVDTVSDGRHRDPCIDDGWVISLRSGL